MHMRPASTSFARVILALVVILSAFFAGSDAQAQNDRITHQVFKSNIKKQSMGRDLWFSMAENYELQGGGAGKYYEVYVASPAKTEIRIALGKATEQKFPIGALKVVTFRIPLAWEMMTSGEVQPKAVHIWSEDADLSAYLLSRNPATSDGMYIIPSIGWGTEYVVASFHSYAYLPGYELPSEFVLVANQDNTVIEVTPSTDLRQGISTAVAYPRGKTFTVTLQRGEAVQYQNSAANGQMEGYDVTGTILTGNKPFGVVAGNMCANIPAENPYCDHICDMLPPTRTWATTYYTAPYKDRKGGDAFRIIAKEDNTVVMRYRGDKDSMVFCILNKYQEFIRHDITEASMWRSDKPFLLVQYCNSTDYPETGTNNGIGDPQMTIVNPVEQFSPFVIFQTPSITTGSAFTNYVNIIVKETAIDQTKYDGKPIRGTLTSLPPIQGYQIFRASNVSPGTHTIESPEGVGAYIYGYGSYDSYGWTAAFGTATFQSPDTVAPEVTTPTQCFTARINAQDIHPDASKLNAIDLDSIYNMSFEIDPNWFPGAGIDKSFYDIAVLDQSKEAYISVIFYDAAGNNTTVISRYVPQTATIAPPLTDFGVGATGSDILKDVTITNTGVTDFNLTKLELQFGNRGFRLVEPVDRSPLRPGEERKIVVAFSPVSQQTMGDTVIFGDDCITGKAVVIGNGGAPDYYVTNADIGPIYVGTSAESDDRPPVVKQVEGVRIVNGSDATVVIETITLSNTVDFELDRSVNIGGVLVNQTPITLGPDSFHEIVVKYNALMEPGAQTDVTFVAADNVGTKVAVVTGKAIAPGAQIVENTVDTLNCVVAGDSRPYQFQIQATGSAATMINAVTVNGATGQFTPVQIVDASNNPVTLPALLNKNEKWFVNTTFNAPPDVNGTYVLTINVIGQDGNVIQNGTVVATAVTEYRAYKFNNLANLNFAPVNYGGAPVTATFEIENTTEQDLLVEKPLPIMGNPGSHPNSFSITNPPTWPIVLAPFGKQTVTVQFDPTLSTAEAQTVNYLVGGDACRLDTFTASAGTIVGGFTAQGFPAPQIFSCAVSTNDVVATTGNSPTGTLSWTITGTNLDRFTTTLPTPMNVTDNQQIRIPVTFTPSAVSQQATYTANMELTYTNEQGRVYTEVVPMSATAGGIVADASSRFALQGNNEVTTGDAIVLPINLDVTKNVPTIDMTTTGIASARFVYTYNEDLLTIENNNVANAVNNFAPGWSLDAAASSVTSGRLEVVLRPAAGTEIVTQRLADIHFLVRLPDQTQVNDSMRLETFELRDATGQAYSTCASTSAQGSYLNLTYRCGDAVFQQMMNGMTGFSSIAPITPNPVTDQQTVTLRYATRVSTPITIEVVDALGNVVDAVMSRVDHQAGAYEVKYDVSNLESGSYVYRFKTDRTTLSQRFIVTK